ncbi:MAG: efflux RND transporter periplasmic adaptor subunit [Gemmataceae bacterium]|nr:efflux RND transporter periplasmic adaptor subunit [Gemmataceae bacterium]
MGKVSWKERVWNSKGKLLAYGLIVLAVAAAVKVMFFDPREVSVAPVVRQNVVAEVQGTGTVTTKVLPRVGSKITGRIDKVLVDEGDFVKEGQLVAVLEDTDLRHQVDRAKARLAAAQASAEQARSSWERAKHLIRTRAISNEEYDVYEEKARVTESAVGVEKAELRYQEFKLSETRVTTFVSGLVTKRWVDPGDAVVAGQPVVTVADTSLVWVAANVDQRFAGKVRKGQPATVILRGRLDKPFQGRVYRVNPQADPVTEEMLVEVAFPLPAKEFQVGQWAEVYIEVGTVSNALVVPKAAVLPFGNDRFVFLAEPDGRVRRAKVEPGATSPRLPVIAVTGELEAGEHVILRPIGLKGGETVRVTQPAGVTPSAK